MAKRRLAEKGADLTRPYEKCLMYGASALTDAELVAVILRCGKKGMGVTELAQKVLDLTPDGSGIKGLCTLSSADYMSLPGIGEVKAVILECVGELSKRISVKKAVRRAQMSEPKAIADYFMELLRHEDQENLHCVMLDCKLRMIGEERISRGSSTMSIVSPRDIFLAAMRHRAVSIALVHNHPSGDPTPSANDLFLTERIRIVGELMEIPLLDHIVIGDRCFVSFMEDGYLKPGSDNENETCFWRRPGYQRGEDLQPQKEPLIE